MNWISKRNWLLFDETSEELYLLLLATNLIKKYLILVIPKNTINLICKEKTEKR